MNADAPEDAHAELRQRLAWYQDLKRDASTKAGMFMLADVRFLVDEYDRLASENVQGEGERAVLRQRLALKWEEANAPTQTD